MDIVALAIIAVFLWFFIPEFLKAREKILEERSKQIPTIYIESVVDRNGNVIYLIYEHWTNTFLGQGKSLDDVKSVLREQYEIDTVIVSKDDVTADMRIR